MFTCFLKCVLKEILYDQNIIELVFIQSSMNNFRKTFILIMLTLLSCTKKYLINLLCIRI